MLIVFCSVLCALCSHSRVMMIAAVEALTLCKGELELVVTDLDYFSVGSYFASAIALTMSAISGLREAPPTRKPSMSGHADSSGAFLALAEPPYWMRIASAVSWSASLAIHSRIACQQHEE